MIITQCDYCDGRINNPTMGNRVDFFGITYDACDLCVKRLKKVTNPIETPRAKDAL